MLEAVQQFEIGRKRKVNNALNPKRGKIFGVKSNCETVSEAFKSVMDSVLKEMGMDEAKLAESEDGAFLAGRRADIIVDGKCIGVFGELHPAVILNFGLDHPVVGFEVAV